MIPFFGYEFSARLECLKYLNEFHHNCIFQNIVFWKLRPTIHLYCVYDKSFFFRNLSDNKYGLHSGFAVKYQQEVFETLWVKIPV